MNLIFTDADFVYGVDRACDHRSEVHARFANAKIEKLIAEAPRVYGRIKETNNGWNCSWNIGMSMVDTHTAVLFNIEALPKKPCMHEPDNDKIPWLNYGVLIVLCKYCNVELHQKWEAVGTR